MSKVNDLHMITNSLYMNSGKLVQNGKNGLNISRTEALRRGEITIKNTNWYVTWVSKRDITRKCFYYCPDMIYYSEQKK